MSSHKFYKCGFITVKLTKVICLSGYTRDIYEILKLKIRMSQLFRYKHPQVLGSQQPCGTPKRVARYIPANLIKNMNQKERDRRISQ